MTNGVFVPEIENMDLSKLKDKTFIAGVSSGDRNKPGIVSVSIKGPFTFLEMIDYVNELWSSRMDHAKVFILNKDINKRNEWLDSNTIDYLIEKHADIAIEEILLKSPEPFTCEAGIIGEDTNADKT
jgi:hypothetical protein